MGKDDKKYPALGPKEIRKEIARQEKAKTKYSMDQMEVEAALTEYSKQLDPILWTNSKGETKAIAWVRRPSMKQIKGLIPPEMKKYFDKPTEVPMEIQKKYETFFYEKMSEMIAIPKYTSKQWEAKANPWFIRMFWQHLADIANLMEGQIEGF